MIKIRFNYWLTFLSSKFLRNLPHIEVILRDLFGKDKEPELKFCRKFISKGDCVLDVGANRGTYTYKFLKYVGAKGLVYAFEPQKNLYRYLERGFSSFKNLKILNLALADKKGEVFLKIENKDGLLALGGASISLKFKNYIEEKINIDKLDNLMISKIDFIKIDVEGFELQVLQGARKKIMNSRPFILVEIDYNMNSKNCPKIAILLNKLGYKVFAITSGKLIPVQFKEFSTSKLNFHELGYRNNFFLIPLEKIHLIYSNENKY